MNREAASAASLAESGCAACELNRVKIHAALEGQDDPRLFDEIRDHVQRCEPCAGYLGDRVRSRMLLGDLSQGRTREHLVGGGCRTLRAIQEEAQARWRHRDARPPRRSAPMRIDHAYVGTAAALKLLVDLDEDLLDDFRGSLKECLSKGYRQILLDLGSAHYVSYMALGVLVERLRHIRSQGGDIRLVGANLYVRRLLAMTGAASMFRVFATETEALHDISDDTCQPA